MRARWDHPRRCGENAPGSHDEESSGGSPPQVRGKRLFGEPFKAEAGITPAGAGKTLRKACYAVAHKDHPRRCGENAQSEDLYIPLLRITPAGAGKTFPRDAVVGAAQDHPRRCGENAIISS